MLFSLEGAKLGVLDFSRRSKFKFTTSESDYTVVAIISGMKTITANPNGSDF